MRAGLLFAFQALLTVVGLARLRTAVRWPHKALWVGYLGLIGFGDIVYWVFNHSPGAFLKTPHRHFALVMCPYLLATVSGIAFLLRSVDARKDGAPRLAELIPALLILTISCKFVLIPMATKLIANGLDVVLFSMMLRFALSVAAIIVCLRVLIGETVPRLLACAMGLLIPSLVSWGFNIEYLADGHSAFTVMDFVWSGGVFLAVIPTILWPEEARRSPTIRTWEGLSYEVRYWLLLLVLIPVTSLSLLRALDPKAASVVSLTILGGVGFGWLASQVLMDRIRSSTELKMIAASATVARQVAHDIRSPLAALEVLMRGADSMPEDEKILMRSATIRIRDIADGMLKKDREALDRAGTLGDEFVPSDEPMETACLRELLRSVLAEKRSEYSERAGIQFKDSFQQAPESIPARIQPGELKRMLSNLLNNAVESFVSGAGTVEVVLAIQDGGPVIEVRDDGRGIEPERLKNLGLPGNSFGNSRGSGLGLHHAVQTMRFFGGRLDVGSQFGKGTTVRLTFR